jgi:FkbM family methyltransferase
MNLNYYLDRYFVKQPRLRRLVTSLFERDRDLDVEIAGASLRINARREHGYLRTSRIIQRSGTLQYELPVLMNLFAIVRNGDTFVDVGANTGLFTHSMARLTEIYEDFRILSIEAHPDTFSRLSHNKHEGVTYLNMAMSDADGELEFVDGAVSNVFTTVEKQNSYNIPGEAMTVSCKRLDDLNLDSDSIILKIDVEGQERQVLDGASHALESGSVRAVYLDGYDDDSINDLLLSHGFRLYEGRTLKPLVGRTFSLLALRECRTIR